MPRRIRRSRQAQTDQNDVWLHIAEDNIRAADRVIDRINGAIFMLAEQPVSGRLRNELRPNLRCFPIERYLIFYTVSDDAIEIRRIMHSARDIIPELFEGD